VRQQNPGLIWPTGGKKGKKSRERETENARTDRSVSTGFANCALPAGFGRNAARASQPSQAGSRDNSRIDARTDFSLVG